MNAKRPLTLALATAISFSSSAFAQQRSAAEQAVYAADQAWSADFTALNLDQSVAALDENGAVLAPNSPIAEGRTAVHDLLRAFFTFPNVKISWKPDVVEVSGDIGVTSGAYQMTFNDPTGKPVVDHGKYVTVWHLGKDHVWRVFRDIFNSDLEHAP